VWFHAHAFPVRALVHSCAAAHELIGLLCAWDRVEAHATGRKLAAVAELFRRNPESGFEVEGRMPDVADEFVADELACALGESRGRADALLTMAWHLQTRLPGTRAALQDGTTSRSRHHRPPPPERGLVVTARLPGARRRRLAWPC